MSRFNTGNPLGSGSPLDLDDNAKNMDEAVNAEQDTFQDRMGKSRLTWSGIVKAGSGDPAIAVDAAARAEAAAGQVQQDAEQIAQEAAQQAASAVIAGVDGQVAVAQGAANRAEAARDAAFVNADVYPDVATGRAAVADGEQFQVVEGDEIVRYRRDNASTQTEVARYPSSRILYDVRSSIVSGIAQTTSAPNLLSSDIYSCSALPEIPAPGYPSWDAVVEIYNAKRLFSFVCNDIAIQRASFATPVEPIETFSDGVAGFSLIIEHSDIRVSALNSKIHFRGYTAEGNFIGPIVTVPFSESGFSTSVINSPVTIGIDGVDISSIVNSAAAIRVFVELAVLPSNPTPELGDSVKIHSPCWVADDISAFRINVVDGILSSEGETW